MSVTAVPILPTKRNYIVSIWIAIVLAVGAAFLLAMQGDDYFTSTQRGWGVQTTASGLKYKVLVPGAGPSPTDADIAIVTYEVHQRDGKVLGKADQPQPMPVKSDMAGLNEALKLMRAGGKIRVWIPAKLAYGAEEKKNPQTGEVMIAANSSFVFDIEMAKFQSRAEFEREMMKNGGPGGPGGMPGPGGGPDGPPPGDLPAPSPSGS